MLSRFCKPLLPGCREHKGNVAMNEYEEALLEQAADACEPADVDEDAVEL
jgi:hypothetical protein